MQFRHAACSSLVVLVLMPHAVRADVLRCTGRDGKVSYQSQPCPDARETRRLDLAPDDAGRAASARAQAVRQALPDRNAAARSGEWSILTLDGSLDASAPSAPGAASASAPAVAAAPLPIGLRARAVREAR